jgi:hypothetical protein
MAGAIWSGVLTFGPVTVPVQLFTATEDHTLHPSRSILASKHLRGPAGARTVVLYLLAIAVTRDRCLAARVFSTEVSMTPLSRSSFQTSPAGRYY